MGSNQSSSVRLPLITKQHWHQIPLPPTIRRKACHGQYKLFKNVLTNQRIEQYSLTLQGDEQYQRYLRSFEWRQQQQSILGTRYFQHAKEDGFCGSRFFARVYLQHTPYRLSSIHQIPLQESLYVLAAALTGFQKLHSLEGCFVPNEDMVGIDCEGRVQVWLNPNFSKDYLFGPKLALEDDLQEEGNMVMEVVALVDRNTVYQHLQVPTLMSYFQETRQIVTFQKAHMKLEEYSKKYRLPIPKYFASMLPLLEEYSVSQDCESRSQTNDPFRSSQARRDSTAHVVHYISPSLLSNTQIASGQQLPSKEQLRSLTCIQQELMERENEATKDTKVTNTKDSSRILTLPTHSNYIKPRVHFNYSSRADLNSQKSPRMHTDSSNNHFQLPLSRIAEHSSLQSLGLTKRVTYSDINEDYELDEELAEDLVRFFNN